MKIRIMACAILIALMLMAPALATEGALNFDEKTPPEYTMDEYNMLTPQQQDEFFLWFESIEAFEAWLESAAAPMPWEAENRDPAGYSWDEYSLLTDAQQEAFIAAFDSADGFEIWLEAARPVDAEVLPWEAAGRTPAEYTWAEYELLAPNQQNAFVEWFGDEAAFEAWLESVYAVPGPETMPWDESDKKPADYTLAEYEALTFAQKTAFTEWFGDVAAFEAWLESATMTAEEEVILSWENGGKTPDAYTWEEFEALTFAQQEAFIIWFGSDAAFEAWLEAVNPADEEPLFPWENDKKQPDAYTMDEFAALTAYQQTRFFVWFKSGEAFDDWFSAVSAEIVPENTEVMAENTDDMTENDAENTGEMAENDAAESVAPEIPAWPDFELMTAGQRIEFFRSFESAESFAAWAEKAYPEDIPNDPMPWDNTNRQPAEYTWEEYEMMSVELQDAFFAWFESPEMFEEWMKTVADEEILIEYGIIAPPEEPEETPPEDE